ncbi:MAG: recombinase RecA [Spirochaetaceae bacterium]|nr:recombinase RecA [Spirochaetaceae bacterium]
MAKSSETSEKTRVTPLTTGEEKEKALEAARLQIEKQFGAGSLMKLGAHVNAAGIETVPSGSILLDEALGIGGYPRGRIIEIFGPESSGKTTLALHAIAEAQKLGGIAAFVDAEHALDPVYAKNLGVNIEDLWISQPDTGEQALEITENLVRSGAVDVIVVDSVAALTPQAEIDGDMGDAHVGLQARLMSQALRKLTATIGKSRTILIFINQIRMKIGVMYGNPETTTGGNALKFYSSVRLEVRKTETIEAGKDEDALGNRVRVKVIKNKVAPPFRRVELEIIFGKGVSALGSILDAAIKYNLIDKKGAWYSYGEEKIGQGRENVKLYLEERAGLVGDLETKLRKLMFTDRFQTPGTAEKKAAKAGPPEASPSMASPGVAAPNMASPGIAPDTDTPPDAAAESAAAATLSGEYPVESGGAKNGASGFGVTEVAQKEPAFEEEPAPRPRGRPPAARAAPEAAPKAAEPPAPRPGPGRPRKNTVPVPDGLF